MIVLDTDIISLLDTQSGQAYANLATGRLHRMLNWYARQNVIDYDEAAAAKFAELKKSRIRVGTMDLKIASIVLMRGALLVTRNLADFRPD